MKPPVITLKLASLFPKSFVVTVRNAKEERAYDRCFKAFRRRRKQALL